MKITIKKSRHGRHMRITVNCDAHVVVTAPFYFSESAIENFLNQKMGWIINKVNYFRRFGKRIVLPRGRRVYAKHKPEAKSIVMDRIAELNKIYNFAYSKITIRSSVSRWGSCSRKRNLNFSYRIAFLPRALADYIIAHELCHLKELNHSKRFWKLVEEAIPDFRERRQSLRLIG